MSPRLSHIRSGPPTPDLVGPTHALPWADRAACVGHDPELWYSDTISNDERHHLRTREAVAKAICAGCSVSAECLADAMERGDMHGIWGGLAPWERRQLRFAGRTA